MSYEGFVNWEDHDAAILNNGLKNDMRAFLRKLDLLAENPIDELYKKLSSGFGAPNYMLVDSRSLKALTKLNNLKP